MSSINILKSFSIIFIGGFIGFYSVKQIQNRPNEKNRQLASITFSKLGSQQFAQQLFSLSINNQSIANDDNDLSTLKATIKAHKSFPKGLAFKWNLPDDVQLISGSATGELNDFTINQEKEFSIEIKNFSKKTKKFISFNIQGNLTDKAVEKSAFFSSKPEDSFEFIVQQYEKEKYENENSNKANLALKKNSKANSKNKAPASTTIDINKVSF